MNKKHFIPFVIAAVGFLFNGCIKSTYDDTQSNCIANTTGIPTAAEIASLQSYITANSITATQHPGGFFYKIVTQGTGATPSLSSNITVKYTGSLTNGNVFDQNLTGFTAVLSQLILGWQKGVPLIQKGGSIVLYLPPSLGYGCSAIGNIPRGSNLIFSIELVDVQ
jgi:FKBP-type peptidyl-prolyl cis-trans isomerase FkpA